MKKLYYVYSTKSQFIIALLLCLSNISCTGETDKRLHSNGGIWGFYKLQTTEDKPFKVLLIGDSVMQGYRFGAIKDLESIANVDVWLSPAHLYSPGLRDELAKVVSTRKYDIIHFNIGLHGWPEGRIPKGQYEPLLKKYVETIQENSPQAILIWASTTPILTKETPRAFDPNLNSIIIGRNKISEKLMEEKNIMLNDLYALMSDHPERAKDKFHWDSTGTAMQAEKVRNVILNVISTQFKCAALTFDDGSHPENTPKILEILKSNRIKATFFLIGDNAKKYEELTKAICADGHEIGNHTLNHKKLTEMDTESIRTQIVETQKMIESICGSKPVSFRAPWLAIDDKVEALLKDENLTNCDITISIKELYDVNDAKRKLVIPEKFKSDSVILTHDDESGGILVLNQIVTELKLKDYKFVKCSQLSKLK